MPNPINRTLAYKDDRGHWRFVGQEDVAAIATPIVILGDPGMGKTVLAQTLGDQPGTNYCRAGRFERADRPEAFVAEGERIVVDGLDEIASSTPGGAVDSVLRQLSRAGNPPFILSCREADWKGATDRTRIEDDYGDTPLLLHLQPFSREDALRFLSDEFPAVDAADILHQLAGRGLDSFYQNPLTLRLLGEVVERTGLLPESRAELLEHACAVMLREENPRHLDDSHVHRSDDELLLAAGAMCATQVLCARSGVFAGPYRNTPDDCVHVADIVPLPFAEFADDALRTRLFQAEGERRFAPIHRVLAEYLGAKWLASCFEAGRSERRIFSLFRTGDGVPTSLRGLHAWIAHFNERLAVRCIAADPYAVLRHGDAETIGLDQARILLAALKTLSENDPYFAFEDWSRHRASGLMRSEFKDDILAIVDSPDRNLHLSVLVLDSMAGTSLARELADVLETIVFDQDRSFDERSCAADAFCVLQTVDDFDEVIYRLLEQGSPDSAALACQVLADVGLHTVPIRTSVGTILAHLGFSANEVHGWAAIEVREIPVGMFDGLDGHWLGCLLDHIGTAIRPLTPLPNHAAESEISDLVRLLTLRFLEADPAIEPARLWQWIGWLNGTSGYDHDTTKRLAHLLGEEQALRAALLKHVVLTPCAENTWMAAHCLNETHLGLFPSHEDVVTLLRASRARAGDGVLTAV